MPHRLQIRVHHPIGWLLISLYLVSNQAAGEAWPQFSAQIKQDYLAYYQSDNLSQLANISIGAALLAHSNLDTGLRTQFQQHLNGGGQLVLFELGAEIGDAGQLLVALPIYAGAYLLSENLQMLGTKNLGEWGNQALRAAILAAPQHLVLGMLTGAGRPTEGTSSWQPFEDNNGVSGHALYGALPLLTLAHMTHRPWLRVAYFTASTIPGLARISEDKHYGSQVLFGWSLAYLSTRTVFNQVSKKKPLLLPTQIGRGVGIALHVKF